MVSTAKRQKASKVWDGFNCMSLGSCRFASDSLFVSKLQELHAVKDVTLTELKENGHIQKRPYSSHYPKPLISNIEVRMISDSKNAAKPPTSAAKPTKNYVARVYRTHDPRGDMILANSLKVKPGKFSKTLVSVNVSGSTGALRFLVDAKDPVRRVIQLTLRDYAREGRLPRLGVNSTFFDLYCDDGNYEGLDPLQPVGSLGTRQFLLYKRKNNEFEQIDGKSLEEYNSCVPWKSMVNMMNSVIRSH